MKQHKMTCSYPEGCTCGASAWNTLEAERDQLRAALNQVSEEPVRDENPAPIRTTCFACAAPLADNQLVKDAMITNNTAAWAKHQLNLLAEMADDHEVPDWFARRVRRIRDGIRLVDPST